jgi:hypothetical protein
MGGFGSGDWIRPDSKTLAEHCPCIDIRQLSRKGGLEPGQLYSWKWQNGSNIVVETKPEAVVLFYGITSNEQPRDDICIEVPISWSSCNYGKARPWFICPGKGCGRRVAKLYLNGKYFLCRHCHDLAYSSQRKSLEFRLLDKSQKICQRLGVGSYSEILVTPKPKGMHWRTYETLVDEALAFEQESLYAMSHKLNNMHNSAHR